MLTFPFHSSTGFLSPFRPFPVISPLHESTEWRGCLASHRSDIPSFTLDLGPSCAFLYDYVTKYENLCLVSMLLD